jgi:hypothetical protein
MTLFKYNFDVNLRYTSNCQFVSLWKYQKFGGVVPGTPIPELAGISITSIYFFES